MRLAFASCALQGALHCACAGFQTHGACMQLFAERVHVSVETRAVPPRTRGPLTGFACGGPLTDLIQVHLQTLFVVVHLQTWHRSIYIVDAGHLQRTGPFTSFREGRLQA